MARRLWWLLIPLCLLCAAGGAAQTNPPKLRIPRVTQPPTLEQFLNGTPREAETQVTDFRQREPGDGVPVSLETTAYLSYDDKNLYVVFVCKDDPKKIRARMAKREDVFADDAVGVVLDTFHDRRRSYLFLSNPLGIQIDGIASEGRDDDYSFDTLWHTEGRLTPDGYIVWMAIPFKSLRFPNLPAQTWGFALGRIIPRNSETSLWPYVTRRLEGMHQQLATLEGLENISPGRNLQFIPYGVFTRARFLDTQVPEFRTDNDARAGLDAKIVFRDALTLDVALNPDFSQVESDEPQVTVNQRFEVFFPEKRPFFIENAGFFESPTSLFFSRRIADPQFGVRLTGKVGRWAIGALATDDRSPGEMVAESDPLHGRRAGIGMLRVQREFAGQSSVSFLAASRDFTASSNRIFGLDTRIKLNPNWVFTGQVMRSYTRGLDGTRVSGPGYFARIENRGRHFVYHGSYSDLSPDFRSELGFIPRVDIREMKHAARYYWMPKGGPVVLFGPDLSVLINWNRQGQVQDWVVDASFGADIKGPVGIGCRRLDAYELFQGLGFRKRKTDCGINAGWLKWLEFNADYGWGSGVNYFPGAGFAPFLAKATSVKAGFTLRPSPRLRYDQMYLYDRLAARRGSSPVGIPEGTSIYDNHILRSKLNYQFTRELSLRAILDYNAVLPNSDLVGLERAKRFTADFLVTYLLNPGTALYVGYTDIYDNLTLDPTVPPSLRRIRSPSTSTGRQFFVKMSYLFRF